GDPDGCDGQPPRRTGDGCPSTACTWPPPPRPPPWPACPPNRPPTACPPPRPAAYPPAATPSPLRDLRSADHADLVGPQLSEAGHPKRVLTTAPTTLHQPPGARHDSNATPTSARIPAAGAEGP